MAPVTNGKIIKKTKEVKNIPYLQERGSMMAEYLKESGKRDNIKSKKGNRVRNTGTAKNNDKAGDAKKRRPNEEMTLQNKFSPLTDLSSEDESEDGDKTTSQEPFVTTKQPKVKIPPVTIYQPDEKPQGSFLNIIKSLAKDKECKITYKNQQYKVHCNSESSFYSLLDGLKQMKTTKATLGQDFNFFTHELPNEKSKRMVVKGLPLLEEEDIKRDLIENNINCESVIILAKKDNPANNRPIYLVNMDKSVDLKEVRSIKYIQNVKITWDKYKNKNRTTQCHKCQKYGHGSRKCYSTPACLHCGEKHLTKDCTKKEETPVCANCRENHRANSKECKVYNDRVNLITVRKTSKPAPKIQPLNPPPRLEEYPRPSWSSEAVEITTPTWVKHTEEATARQAEDYDTAKDMSELMRIMKNLQQLIDIKHMISIFRTLESELRKCKNEQEKFMVFITFMTQNGS